MNPILFILPGIAIALLFAGIYFTFFAKKDQARAFIQDLTDAQASPNKKALIQQQVMLKRKRKQDLKPWAQKLDTKLEQANWLLKPEEFLIISFGLAAVFFVFALLVFKWHIILCVLMAIVGYFVTQILLKIKIMLRMGRAESQFADVLEMLGSCFKSGYGFNRAAISIADNFTDPWGTEFNKLAAEMNLGATMDEALTNMAKRIPLADVSLFATALMIQRETGGNMVELLETLSNTIRDRFKLKSKVGAISAQGKASAFIVFLIPPGLGGLFFLIMPHIMFPFVDSFIGKVALGFAFCLQMMGGFVLKKIVTIEV